ncbi:MAG: cysteine--tRNA ligase [Micrococcales bacterium]
MGLSLYDSKLQQKVPFIPLTEGRVGIYVCGPTVQSEPHAGHLRSALVYDIFKSWMNLLGLETKLVRNVTDIDDKILDNASAQGIDWRDLAARMNEAFNEAYAKLAIAAPDVEPKATEHIFGMQKIIASLISRGHAYQATDGSANVYFDSASWPAYGELTNQKLADMDGEAAAAGKRAAHDFALWKAHKPGEPETASWQSPWGLGRPGWHIECSAMSTDSLGGQFDIHGGGLDLRFPHHENELAQSRAAGFEYANHWVHNGLVNSNGTKMSKSLGNFVSAADLFEQDPRGLATRYYLLTAHYRANLEYHDGIIEEAKANIERIENFLRRAAEYFGSTISDSHFLPVYQHWLGEKFIAAMNDDLNVPTALAALHDSIREGNSAIDAGESSGLETPLVRVLCILNVLNINPMAPQWIRRSSVDSVRVEELIAARNAARAAKDFAAADAILDELSKMGVSIEDAAGKTHWSVD